MSDLSVQSVSPTWLLATSSFYFLQLNSKCSFKESRRIWH